MTSSATRDYGLHLMIDGYGADPGCLEDINLLFHTLNELPGLIGMQKIGFPHLAEFTQEDIAGISGIIMIVESHISIHTYAKKDFLSADVYSCKRFDHEKVTAFLKEAYKIADMDVTVIERGKRFPVDNLHD